MNPLQLGELISRHSDELPKVIIELKQAFLDNPEHLAEVLELLVKERHFGVFGFSL